MSISSGIGGRLALGAVILVHVVVYNETGGPSTVLAALIATSCALLSGQKLFTLISEIEQLQYFIRLCSQLQIRIGTHTDALLARNSAL